MRGTWIVAGPGLLVLGALLVGYAVATGGAHLYLVLIFPVVAGTSPLFAVGVLLLIAGIFLLPFLWAAGFEEPSPSTGGVPPSATPPVGPKSRSGGILFVGPVPVFLGGWRENPPISYRWAVVAGAALFLVALLILWLFFVR